MKIFDEKKIEAFAKYYDDSKIFDAKDFMESIIGESIEKIKFKLPILTSNFELIIMNECGNNTATVNSYLELMLVIDAPQIELNTIKITNNKFISVWKKFVLLWQNRKKKNLKKKKKSKGELQTNNLEKYNIYNLQNELMQELTNYFNNVTLFYLLKNGFKISCKETLGIDIVIHLAFNSDVGYKIYNFIDNNFMIINLAKRDINISKKSCDTRGNYYKQIRIFNNLYYNINGQHLNQMLIESIMFNVPDDFFILKNTYNNFLKIINFLNINNYNDFVCIQDKNINIYEEHSIAKRIPDFKRFVKNLCSTI